MEITRSPRTTRCDKLASKAVDIDLHHRAARTLFKLVESGLISLQPSSQNIGNVLSFAGSVYDKGAGYTVPYTVCGTAWASVPIESTREHCVGHAVETKCKGSPRCSRRARAGMAAGRGMRSEHQGPTVIRQAGADWGS